MGFNIGNQQAANINNVEGNQTIHGGQHGDYQAGIPTEWAEALVNQLYAMGLSSEATQAKAIQAELNRPNPDQHAIAERLTRLTNTLESAGKIAQAGQALRGPLASLAGWLGAIGIPILHLLSS
jgi:hypothetical protein